MENQKARGSDKLLAAWKARSLTEESVREIAAAFEKSSGTVLGANVVGGHSPTGMQVSVSYEGDDVPQCGNDIAFWLRWHRTHGGTLGFKPPRVIINGTPYPDLVRLDLDFGHVEENTPGIANIAGPLVGR